MAEEGNESRFVCKLCSRKFPCGKSLGGHMRSHVVANSAELQEKVELNMKKNYLPFVSESKFAESGNLQQSAYGLRENPKKTWRAVDSRLPLPLEKVCKQCGKGFQSMKALCGHMACHSDKDKGAAKDDHDNSWTSESQKMVFDSQSDTEAEEKRLRTRSSKRRKCKKIAEDSPFVLANNGSSSVSEIDGQEQEEVAKCLMMMSRDSGIKGGVYSVVESSDNNSVVMETKSSSTEMRISRKGRVDDHGLNHGVMLFVEKNELKKVEDGSLDGDETAKMEDSDSGYFLDECAKAESDVSVGWFRRNGGFSEFRKPQMSLKLTKSWRSELRKSSKGNAYDDVDDDDDDDDDDDGMDLKCGGSESRKRKHVSENQESWYESARVMKNGGELCSNSQKKSKYECLNCKKIFKSYQALGGHRPCHKRSNGSCESRDESGENSPDDASYYRTNAKFVESSSKKKSSAKSSSHLAEKKSKSKKNNKPHACPFCDRVFKNGQALGGHKRSHFLPGHDESNNLRSQVEKPDLLDLNLPAPEADEDEGGGQFFSW